jgi:hypothetical protein
LIRTLKVVLFLLCLVPFFLLIWGAFTGNLGANPIEAITHTTGDWILRFLVLTLCITPLRRLTGWNQAIRFRRMLGLFAFFYACIHFAIYCLSIANLNLADIGTDIAYIATARSLDAAFEVKPTMPRTLVLSKGEAALRRSEMSRDSVPMSWVISLRATSVS